MKAKGQKKSIHQSQPTSPLKTAHLKERRLYELDKVYLRQLHRLSQIVWNAKFKHSHTAGQPISNSFDKLTDTDNAAQTQKTL